ncbi:MAG: stage V sporulation protein AD [Bacillota bacterium]|nr:stage V sporulation protein AD [Bacillota bacterium]
MLSGAAVVGPMEKEGPLGDDFDNAMERLGPAKDSWETSEIDMTVEAVTTALNKAKISPEAVDVYCGGDLLNQICAANFTARKLKTPFLGLYNACATMAEGLLLCSSLIGSGLCHYGMVSASSHNATSERQYRFPTELGVQRPMTAQWTVTGAGSMVLGADGQGPYISGGVIGRVVDLGIKDPNEMGAAMAPAAFDTIQRYFTSSKTTPDDFDLILTGDLGYHGHSILLELCKREGLAMGPQYQDSGVWIYDKKQDVHAGGSGAGCSASVWSTHLLHEIQKGKYKKILLVGTGALLSPLTIQQGNSIPAIAHAVVVETGEVTSC